MSESASIDSCPAQNKGIDIAYVLLWFPLSSETFIFREIEELRKAGLSINIYTLYGKSLKGCSGPMKNYAGLVRRMGITSTLRILRAFLTATIKNPGAVWQLLRKGLFRRMRDLESQGENIWAFMSGFLLAEMCRADGIKLIHSSWANGPATAAWIASKISGIPFAFTGRAGDIYPQDGILAEKAADALFIRTNNAANVKWLASFCKPEQQDKVKLVYNSFVFNTPDQPRSQQVKPPYRLLAIGRFVRTKGFPELLTAMARLKRENFPVTLTLIGDGAWRRKILKMRKDLRIEDNVSLLGFVPNDKLSAMMREHDLLVVPSVVHNNGDRDGIPNVIMEALSMRMPVVATDVCGISEVIHNGQTGLLVPQRNPAALANAIRQMFANWPDALTMADKGKTLVEKMFAPKANSEALKDLYLNAVKDAHNA